MNTKYRITVQSDVNGIQLAELTIQSEIKLLISPAELNQLRVFELEELGFGEALSAIQNIIGGDLLIPEQQRQYFEVPFTAIENVGTRVFNGELLDRIGEKFAGKIFCRLAGACPNTSLVFGRATDFLEIPVNDQSLSRIQEGLTRQIADPEMDASVKDTIGLILGAIAVGMDAWRLWREEQDREREREERERAAEEKKGKDAEGRRSRQGVAAGGPAFDKLKDDVKGWC